MSALILTCSTGQGHNSCAGAIKEYYNARGEVCEIAEALDFASRRLSRFICWGHVTMYRHFHGLFQIGYKYSEKHSLFSGESGVMKLLSKGTDNLYHYIQDGRFDQVICTHVFGSLMVTQMQKKYHLPISTCLVATDYTCNPGTKESEVERYFIPDLPLSVSYECPSIADHQIISSGIPIRQMFYRSVEKAEAKKAFGIPQTHRHLIMMCGSMGCGPMKKLAKQLSRQLPDEADLTIVCGTNKNLKKKLQRRYTGKQNIHIHGYVEDISLLMDSADLYLTKPGGISVTEAAIKNLPMVFIDAVAGCEEYNRIYFIRKQAAKTGTTVRDISRVCTDTLCNSKVLRDMGHNLQTWDIPNAAGVIYSEMHKLLMSRDCTSVS